MDKHQAHDGINSNISRIHDIAYCYGLAKLLRAAVSNCRECLVKRAQSVVVVPLRPIVVEKRMQKVCLVSRYMYKLLMVSSGVGTLRKSASTQILGIELC